MTCPHHIEFVNHYVHRGKVEGEGKHLEPTSILGRSQILMEERREAEGIGEVRKVGLEGNERMLSGSAV